MSTPGRMGHPRLLGRYIPLRKDYAEWFVARAAVFGDVDREASASLSRRCRIKMCFDNCARNSTTRRIYHEGFVLMGHLGAGWIHHAFLVQDGTVIDPTLAIGDRIPDDAAYAGMAFPDAGRHTKRPGSPEARMDGEFLASLAARKTGPKAWAMPDTPHNAVPADYLGGTCGPKK